MSLLHAPGLGLQNAIKESQRALELRKFFAPFNPSLPVEQQDEHRLNASIHGDGALCAFAETVLWRLRGVRAMVSLIDRTTQYFIAGVERGAGGEIALDGQWFGCSTVATPGGLCENTIAIDRDANEFPCFEVQDLSSDPRFAALPVVDGSIESYRFYAGTPITTDNGKNIGSLFVFDRAVRPQGLSLDERKWLNQSALNVMEYLETKRAAAERRRAALMSEGIAALLDYTADKSEDYKNNHDAGSSSSAISRSHSPARRIQGVENNTKDNKGDKGDKDDASSKILDRISSTLEYAVSVLRESLELTHGGVIFLDIAPGHGERLATNDSFHIGAELDPAYEEPGHREGKNLAISPIGAQFSARIRSPAPTSPSLSHVSTAHEEHGTAKVLAISAATRTPTVTTVHGKMLNSLTSAYPKGHVWYMDEDGFFPSLEQTGEAQGMKENLKPNERSRSSILERQKAEADVLLKIFHEARQVIFLPVWDVANNQWHSGCFVWSQSAVPVFTVKSDIAYISSFTNSVMVGISRLDALAANAIKTSFISSISHEFRSPLHGILASSDFLRETNLDSTQTEFISMIQNCSSTLLDTINHVLDYGKINFFERRSTVADDLSHGLYENCNIALLCEETVFGMMAANKYRHVDIGLISERIAGQKADGGTVEIILDFEYRDWSYSIQPGALRRIIMNLFGNAQKFTHFGFIHVRLRVQNPNSAAPRLVMNIMDSGIGMNVDYMQRKLYKPFAQGNSFNSGVGLGLSIAWSVVRQLEGKIVVRSEEGKGTDVEVVLPLRAPVHAIAKSERADNALQSAEVAQSCLQELQKVARNLTAAIRRNQINAQLDANDKRTAIRQLEDSCLQGYLQDWYGFSLLPSSVLFQEADLVLEPRETYHISPDFHAGEGRHRHLVLLLLDNALRLHEKDHQTAAISTSSDSRNFQSSVPVFAGNEHIFRTVHRPLGPYKLATALLALLQDAKQPKEEIPAAATDLRRPATKETVNKTAAGLAAGAESSIATNSAAHSQNVPEIVTLPFRPGMEREAIPRAAVEKEKATDVVTVKSTTTYGLNILIVDDNDLNLALLHRYLLKRQGGKDDRIVLARDGVEAVTAYKAEQRTGSAPRFGFDIILMDISMPNMDGFEATRRIRDIENKRVEKLFLNPDAVTRSISAAPIGGTVVPEGSVIGSSLVENGAAGASRGNSKSNYAGAGRERAYVVALTGLASKKDRDTAIACGIDEFLTKPVGFGRVGEILERLASEKGMLVADGTQS